MHLLKRWVLYSFFSLHAWVALGQPTAYMQQITDTLTSPFFRGRGYVQQGHFKAAQYIASEFKRLGLKAFDTLPDYLQAFPLTVNTFPAQPSLMLNGITLTLGDQFWPHAASGSGNGTGRPIWIQKNGVLNMQALIKVKTHACPCLVDGITTSTQETEEALNIFAQSNSPCKAIVVFSKPAWTATYSQKQYAIPVFFVREQALPSKIKKVNWRVDATLYNKGGYNIAGWLPATQPTDTALLFSAHYDHMGSVGNVYFPGANDNASGVATLLALAERYANTFRKYNIVFVGFGAEEVGLVGAYYMAAHPVWNIPALKFMFNLDLLGGGSQGITVVNATAWPTQFALFKNIALNYGIPTVNPRDNAPNSDHYPFTRLKVPAFFIYAMGDVTAYHNPADTADGLTFANVQALMNAIQALVLAL